MQKLLIFFLGLICSSALYTQHLLEIDGKVKVSEMDTTSNADSLVVWLPDGTLAVRNVSSLTEYQILTYSNDTIYLSNGGFVKLPADNNAGWNMTTDTIWTVKKSVGIGTAFPNGHLHISDIKDDNSPTQVNISGNGQKDVDGAVKLILDGRRGATQYDAGSLEFDIDGNEGASITSRVGEFNSVVAGANLIFSTSKDSASLSERMRISNTGEVGIGTMFPMEKLHVDGKVKIDSVEKLNSADSVVVWLPDHTLGRRDASSFKEMPSNPSNGDLAYYNGSTWQSVSAGENRQVLMLKSGVPTWSDPCGQLSLWQFYGGGYIFYLDPTGCHGLVAAPYDLTSSDWGCKDDSIGTSINFGTGQANTNSTIAGCAEASFAAKGCDDFTFGGYSDWYLPSKQELDLMWHVLADRDGSNSNFGYTDLGNVGGFFADATAGLYWSSSEHSTNKVFIQNFHDGTQNVKLKNESAYIRPIRAF